MAKRTIVLAINVSDDEVHITDRLVESIKEGDYVEHSLCNKIYAYKSTGQQFFYVKNGVMAEIAFNESDAAMFDSALTIAGVDAIYINAPVEVIEADIDVAELQDADVPVLAQRIAAYATEHEL